MKMKLTRLNLHAAILTLIINLSFSKVIISTLNSPLLPFYLGKTRITEHKHTFLHYVQTQPIYDQLTNIEQFYNHLEDSIYRYHNDSVYSTNYIHLPNMLAHAKHFILTAKTKLNNITPHRRNKRGLINIIGKTSKWLFGTLDSEDGEKYGRAISILSNNQNSLHKEISLQISLTRQLINSYNDSITLLNENQKMIRNKIQNLEKQIRNTAQYLNIQNTLHQIILNCQNLITFLDNIENALMFAKLNTLHSAVMSASELYYSVSYLTKLYGEQNIITFKNVISYYQLAGLQVSYSEDKIIFAVHFPISLKEIFDTFHLFPIPINQSIILPNQPFLTLGMNHLQYEEEECPVIEDTHICQNKLQPTNNDCISTLIKDAEIHSCHTVKTSIKNPIIKPINNKYIVAIPTEEPLKIQQQCGDEKENKFISDPSLIEIEPNCEVNVSSYQFINKEEIIQGMPFTLPKIYVEPENSKEDQPIDIKSINIHEISELQEKVKLLQPFHEVIHPVGWSFVSIATTILVIAMIFWITWFIYKKKIEKKKQPQEEHHENDSPPLTFSI